MREAIPPTNNEETPQRKQTVSISIDDTNSGKVDLTYNFNPPIAIDSPETPALKLGRKAIRAIEEGIE